MDAQIGRLHKFLGTRSGYYTQPAVDFRFLCIHMPYTYPISHLSETLNKTKINPTSSSSAPWSIPKKSRTHVGMLCVCMHTRASIYTFLHLLAKTKSFYIFTHVFARVHELQPKLLFVIFIYNCHLGSLGTGSNALVFLHCFLCYLINIVQGILIYCKLLNAPIAFHFCALPRDNIWHFSIKNDSHHQHAACYPFLSELELSQCMEWIRYFH